MELRGVDEEMKERLEKTLYDALEIVDSMKSGPVSGVVLQLLGAGLPITGAQCRGARGMLRVKNMELSLAANLNPTAISKFEAGLAARDVQDVIDIRRALEGFGAVFYKTGEIGTVATTRKKV